MQKLICLDRQRYTRTYRPNYYISGVARGSALGAPAPPFAHGRSSTLCNISLAHLVSSDVSFVQLCVLPHCDKGHSSWCCGRGIYLAHAHTAAIAHNNTASALVCRAFSKPPPTVFWDLAAAISIHVCLCINSSRNNFVRGRKWMSNRAHQGK